MSPRTRQAVTSQESSLSEPLLPEHDERDSLDVEGTGGEETTTTTTQRQQRSATSQLPLSRNIPIVLAYTAFVFAGRSVWSQSVLSTFVFLLRNQNYRAVGLITAVMGLAQLATSFPSGFLADRYRRDSLLKTAAVVALFAMVATLYAVYTSDYKSLVVALAIWGSYFGMANTATSALFADSIPTGLRSKYFTQRSLLVNLGFAVGPIVSLILFAVLGDHWGITDCAIVLAVGQAICLPAVVLLCFLSDDHVVPHEEQVDSVNDDDSNTHNHDDGASTLTRDIMTADYNQPDDENEGPTASISRTLPYSYYRFLRDRRIAVLIATADLISGLASGMSIRYFPIFFVENLNMGPVLVQVVYASTPVFLASCMKLAQIISTRFGRCRVSVTFKWTGILLMYALVIAYKQNFPRWLVCSIYIIRTAFINSTGALTRSVLMDHVPPSERGRWAALESLNMFSWSGSAALGGYLVGVIGMVPLFCTTAAFQLLATFPLIILSTEEKLEGHDNEPPNEQRTISASTTLTEPLLSANENTDQRRRGSV